MNKDEMERIEENLEMGRRDEEDFDDMATALRRVWDLAEGWIGVNQKYPDAKFPMRAPGLCVRKALEGAP